MKTYYEGHDRLYQTYKANGQVGWSTEYDQFKTHVEGILAHGIAPASGKLLDLGCGAGNMALWFANKGYRVAGIDISPTAIEWAQENAREMKLDADFHVGTVTTLDPFPDNSFDFVFDGYCLHCIIGDDRGRVLANVLRVLKPGGYFLANMMCGEVDVPELTSAVAGNGVHYDPACRCLMLDGSDVAVRYFGHPDEIVWELRTAGFEIQRWIVDATQQASHNDLTIEARKP